MFECRAPQSQQEFEQYYHLRWQILRKPLNQVKGSEKDELETQAVHRAIFDIQGNVIAVARLHYCGCLAAQIRYMAVDGQYQGKGLGQQLITELEQHAGNLGIVKVTLKAREKAVNFYEKLSYENLGLSHVLFNQIKHFAMEKHLPSNSSHLNQAAMTLQETWHKTIPLSKAMNITIGYYDQETLITTCDEAFNKNLHNTMFAGSVYTLATLTGWGWVYLLMQQQNICGDIVLADGNIRYHAPVEGVAFAKTSFSLCDGGFESYQVKKKAKLKVEVIVMCGEQVAATFKGLYFVLLKE